MLSHSIRTREVRFACLFGPPRFIARDEASKVYSAVCDALGYDDLVFRYSTSDPPARTSQTRGFSIQLKRQEGSGEFAIIIDNPGIPQPIRLLVTYTWPSSSEHVRENFDTAAEAVWKALADGWQKVVAEVRYRAQVSTPNRSGLEFIRNRILSPGERFVDSLGTPLSTASVRLSVLASRPDEGNSLSNPERELTIEVLREDPSGLYLELKSTWPQLPPSADGGVGLDLSSLQGLRPIDHSPSEYVSESYEYLLEAVQTLEQKEKGK